MTDVMIHPLDDRLRSVADFVRDKDRVIDVGTDHAYLPIALCASGKTKNVLATDINKGPLTAAARHIRAAGMGRSIATRQCDGVASCADFSPDTVCICGMGGDLTAAILEAAPWLRRAGMRLILQPMTHAEAVRFWLCTHGFSIVDEKLSRVDKIYQTVCADYTGENVDLSLPLAYFGPVNAARGEPLFREMLSRQKGLWEKRRAARAAAHQPTDEEDQILAFLGQYE